MASTDMQVTVKLVDQMSKQMMLLQRQVASLDGGISKAGKNAAAVSASFSKLGDSFGRAAKAGATLAAIGTGALVVSGAKLAMNFEKQSSSLKALTGMTDEQLKASQDLAYTLGEETTFSAYEALQAQEELIKAGVDLEQVMSGGTKGALDLAAAGGIEVADAATIASTALNAFKDDNLSVSAAANIMAGASNASAASVDSLQLGLAQSSAVAAGMGVSFNETNAALAVFANNGLKGSDAGTSLKTMLMNLNPVTDTQIELFKELGIMTEDGKNKFYDASGSLKDMSQISGILQKSLSGMTDEQRAMALETMFGSDAIRAGNILYKEGADGINNMYAEMGKVTAAEVAAEKTNNLWGALDRLRSTVETKLTQAFTNLNPILTDLTTRFTEWVSSINVDALVTNVSNLFNNISNLYNFIKENQWVLPIVAGAITGLLVPAFYAWAAAAGAAAKSTLLAAAPFIIMGALIGAFAYMVIKNWDSIKLGAQLLWAGIKAMFSAGVGFLKSIWKTATSFLKSVWTSFVGGIKAITSAFWNTIKSLWNGAINTIKSVATAFWNRVKTGMSNMWDAVKNAFSSAGNFIKGIFLSFVNNIKERFQSLMDKLKTAKNIVANAFQSMVDKAKEKFRNMLLAIQMKVIEIITKMQELKDKIIEKITSIDLKSIGENMMIGLAAGIIDKIPLVGNAAADAVRSAANRAEQEGQIQSPSRVFMKIGAFLSEGMALGIQKDIPKIEGSISEISAKIEEWKKNDYQKQIDDLKADGELSEAMKMEAERTKENLDIQLQAATERIDKFKSDMGSIQGIFQEAFGMRKDLQGGIVTEIVNAKEELKEIEKSLAEEKTKEEQDQEKIASLQAEYDAKKMFLEKHNQDVVDLSAMIQKEEMKRSLDSIDLLKFEMKEKLQVMKSGLKEQVKMFFDVFSEVEKTKKGKALKKGTNTFASLFMSLGGGFSMPNIPAFANGVNNFGGGVAMVGERGRELVTLPRGSSVVPNKQTENIMNSNNKNVTFNITQKSGESGKEMADYIMLKLRSL